MREREVQKPVKKMGGRGARAGAASLKLWRAHFHGQTPTSRIGGPGMPDNFSMAPSELEFSLIFTFSRHPPRGSAIVRAASLRPPTTITEKMQRTAAEYTYLPTLTTQRREAVDSNTLQ